jgi:predicted GNAT superfamily acetyltransferase
LSGAAVAGLPDNLGRGALREACSEDIPAVRALNETAVPHVNSIDAGAFEGFLAEAAYFRVVSLRGEIAAFLVGLRPGAIYASPNYRWFCENYADFLYIDRLVVASEFHRRGIGMLLYEDIERFAQQRAPLLGCEVNLVPANPGSLAFHERFGFSQVATQETDGGAKTVSLMVKRVDGG